MLFQPTLPPMHDISFELQIGTETQQSHYEMVLSPEAWTKIKSPLLKSFDVRVVQPEAIDRTEAFDQLRSIANLQENWDRYGAERVCDECIKNAKSIISSLPSFVPSPDIFPNPNGTVTLEWDEDVGSFSIELGKEEFSSFVDFEGKQRYYKGHFELGLAEFADSALQALFPTQFEPSESIFSVAVEDYAKYGYVAF
ncbi:MAG: hypothetical protein KDI83_00490 [Gammaproteobacteria bacterium]|nr:hypothetical protein [Gammaproteobacteria bacterium]